MDAVGDGITGGVALRNGEGGARNIGGVNRCAGQFLCKRYGDAAGAGTDIGDLQAFAGASLFAAGAVFADGQAVESNFDDVLGFGAGNQDVRRYFKLEAPEFLFAAEMLGWLAGSAAGDEGEIAICVC